MGVDVKKDTQKTTVIRDIFVRLLSLPLTQKIVKDKTVKKS